MAKPAVLLIGGLDPQGCAGMAADVATIISHHCHPVPVITCLTEQTSRGLTHLGAVTEPVFLGQYYAAIADFDIVAIKIGLIPNIAIARAISMIIEQHDVPIVLDTVLTSSAGGISLESAVQDFIVSDLLAKITLLTPNLPELAALTQTDNLTIAEGEPLAANLLALELNACLVKGGHADSAWASDYFVDHNHRFYCYSPKLAYQVRGTGCVLASSIASYLALGHDIRDAVVLAKAYLNRGIRQAKSLGGYRVVNHSMDAMVLADMPKLCYQRQLIGKQFNFAQCPQRLGIYPVVDSSDWIAKLLPHHITTIQLRMKNVSQPLRQHHIKQAVSYCDQSIALFINDDWQLAIAHHAYGVHLGQQDLDQADLTAIEQAGLRLGVSTHSYWELARALAVNPSYIALGPVFATTSKQMPFAPQGVEQVRVWVKLLADHYPLVAIGGIDQRGAAMLKTTGVGSVAMISAITQATDYKTAINDLVSCWYASDSA